MLAISPASEPIWAVVSGFAGEARANRPLIMLQAYVDESVGDGIYAMAGYIASAEQWAAFSDEWRQFLEMSPKIDYFKFSEAMHLSGEFQDWREEARDEKLSLLYKVIGAHAAAFVAVGIKIDEHKEIFGSRVIPRAWRSPYHLLLYSMISELARHQNELYLDGPIDFIFDEQVMEEGQIYQRWEGFKIASRMQNNIIGSTPIFRDDKSVRPLQAADMLAGRMLASWRIKFDILGPRPIPHYTSQKDVPGFVFVWTRQELLNMLERMRRFNRTIITGSFGPHRWASLPYEQ